MTKKEAFRVGQALGQACMTKSAVNWAGLGSSASTGAGIGAGIGAPFGGVGAGIGAALGGLGGALYHGIWGKGDETPAAVGAGPGAAPTELPAFMTPQVMEYLKSKGINLGAPGAAAPTAAPTAGRRPSPYQPTERERIAPYIRYMGLRGPGEFAARNQAMLAGLGRRTRAQQTADWLRAMLAPL